MSLETWVGLARNGLCVVSDLMPESLDQLGRWPNGMTTMNYLIGPLQFAAVLFNVQGALGFPGALLRWFSSRKLTEVAAASKCSVAAKAAARKQSAATIGLCFAFLRCTLAPAFLVLALNSCKKADEWQVQYALLAMQVGLSVALWAMRKDFLEKWNQTHNCNVIALIKHDGSDGGRHLAYAEACCDAGLLDTSLADAAFSKDGKDDSPAAVKKRGDALRKKANDLVTKGKTTLDDLLAHAEKGKQTYDLEVKVWVLNIIAFCGYAVFPLTYFGPFPRSDFYEWLGNFVGDFAWTVEPYLVLAAHMAATEGLAGESKPKKD